MCSNMSAGSVHARRRQPLAALRPDAGRAEPAATLPSGAMPVFSNRKMSCIVMTSPSMPVISVIAVTLRVPSDSRVICTTSSIADAICCRIAFSGMFRFAIATIVSSRYSASRGAVGVDGRQAAVVAGVHRLQHVQRFLAADLADDDAVGPHTERIDDELALPDGALALDVRRPGFQPHDVPLPQHQLRGVLDRDDSLADREMKPESTFSSVVLPAPVPPETIMFSRHATAAAGNRASAASANRAPTRSCAPSRSVRNRRIDSDGTVERQRRNDGVDARAVLQPGIDHRTGFVDAPADRADDPLDDLHAGGDRLVNTTSVSSSRPSRSM